MTEGCPEKIDWEFLTWILWKGRDSKHREGYRAVLTQYPKKCVVLHSQRDLTRFMKEF